MAFPYNEAVIRGFVKLLENETIPIIEDIVKALGELLEKAEATHKSRMMMKTMRMGIGAIGTRAIPAAMAGLILAPIGGPLPLIPFAGIIGGSLFRKTVLGTLDAADIVIEKVEQRRNKEELGRLVEKFATTKNDWEGLLSKEEDLESYLYKLKDDYWYEDIDTDESVSNQTNGIHNTSNSNYVLQFLKANIYSNEEIQAEDIKNGDHIYRPLQKKIKGYPMCHHGVYVGNNEIADFGPAGKKGASDGSPVIRPLSKFLEEGRSNELYRRNYKGFSVPVPRTIALAKKIASKELVWNPYKLLENNCEHFATFLKLEKPYSEQASLFFVASVKALEKASKVPKIVHAGARAVRCVAKVTNKVKSVIGMAQDTATVSNASKLVKGLGPIVAGIDIASLIYDWKKSRPDLEAIQVAMELMLRDLTYYKFYAEYLKDIIRETYPQLE